MAPAGTRRDNLFGARTWIGLALGLLVLALAARNTDLRQVWEVLGTIQPVYVLLAVGATILTPLAKTVRWRWLFYPQRVASHTVALSGPLVIGQAVNLIVPGRFGELARTYLGGEETGISKSYVFGTIAAEKLLDLVMLAALVAVLVPLVALPERFILRTTPVLVMAAAVGLAIAVFLAGRKLWLALMQRTLNRLSPDLAARWENRLRSLMDGLSVLSAGKPAPGIWGWTVIAWVLSVLTNWFLFLAFGLPPTFLMALFLLVVLQGGVAIPSTPGKIGVFQYLCVAAMSVFGVPSSVSFSYGVVLYAIAFGVIGVWAALALWSRSLNVRRLREATAELPETLEQQSQS
jgi:uncharacterized protein (TIRG00374 family)